MDIVRRKLLLVTIGTPHYYRQFALCLGKESPYTFSKFNPLYAHAINMDTF